MMEHHALLLAAENPLACDIVDYGFSISFECRTKQFGISDVRSLTQTAYRRPHEEGSDKQTLLVATEFITEEAQHALLKLIEEPPQSTLFVFLVPQGYRLLPTLESRFSRQRSTAPTTEVIAVFRDFKVASIAQRMEQIEVALKAKDTSWQFEMKKGLASLLVGSSRSYNPQELRNLAFIQQTLLTRGASNKFLLEHLALTL